MPAARSASIAEATSITYRPRSLSNLARRFGQVTRGMPELPRQVRLEERGASACCPRQLRGRVRVDQRLYDAVQIPVEHLVEVVGLVVDPVVADPVLREVVGAHALAAVHRAHLAAPLVAGGGGRLVAGGGQQ